MKPDNLYGQLNYDLRAKYWKKPSIYRTNLIKVLVDYHDSTESSKPKKLEKYSLIEAQNYGP